MQLTFPFISAPWATSVQSAGPGGEAMTVAEALHRGEKVAFPKHANAIRVTVGDRTAVVLKTDADTLRGAGVATSVEFGTVKNDARGHPVWKSFRALVEAAGG
jgi:hypothetical protein